MKIPTLLLKHLIFFPVHQTGESTLHRLFQPINDHLRKEQKTIRLILHQEDAHLVVEARVEVLTRWLGK